MPSSVLDVECISLAARSSPLSRAQVAEVLLEIRQFFPRISFVSHYLETAGDKDLQTSLRMMGKTDFFSREIDEMLLAGRCRIAIHSAKDLPEPLPEGLQMVALTRGVDPSDSLVLRGRETLYTLPTDSIIATSSKRREEAVKSLRADLLFVDIRGKIAERLRYIEKGKADGVVVAESALIRLGLTYLNRLKLPMETAPFQGQLAILAREKDTEMVALFSSIDVRKGYEEALDNTLFRP